MIRKGVVSLLIFVGAVFLGIWIYGQVFPRNKILENNNDPNIVSGKFNVERLKTNDQWRKILSPEQFYILRESGTELPFTGVLDKEYRKGTYYSVGCDLPVFRSEQKYDSGTGWPSFWAPVSSETVVLRKQFSPLGVQIEVLDTCGGHLGHVFDDGPKPTGKRYCMNSVALRFVPDVKQ